MGRESGWTKRGDRPREGVRLRVGIGERGLGERGGSLFEVVVQLYGKKCQFVISPCQPIFNIIYYEGCFFI